MENNNSFDKDLQITKRFSPLQLFRRDYKNQEGVPFINIYLLRLLFILMFFFLTYQSWNEILNHTDVWNNATAAAWCMWGSYSAISFIGILYPLKMLPIVLFEIVYKVTWLATVAYPLWISDKLAGTPEESMANIFIWVIFPIVAMPWTYFYKTHILGRKAPFAGV